MNGYYCKIYSIEVLFHPPCGLLRLALSIESSFPPQEHTGDGSSGPKRDSRDAIPNKYPDETAHTVRHPEGCEYDRASAEDQIPLDKLEHAVCQGRGCRIEYAHDRYEHCLQCGAVRENRPDVDRVEECRKDNGEDKGNYDGRVTRLDVA